MGTTPGIIIVRRDTRMQGLRRRWGTRDQAKFVLQRAQAQDEEMLHDQTGRFDAAVIQREASFSEYIDEDAIYNKVIERLAREFNFGIPVNIIDRELVPTFDFWNTAVVVIVGQDGLVANTAKYVGDVPIVAVNPDPSRFDGVLLPFKADQARQAVQRVLESKYAARDVTLAEVTLNDTQRLLAFNDIFVGRNSHASARYTLIVGGRAEAQSSSGVLVSTGAGSTGWMSSVFNMAAGVSEFLRGPTANQLSGLQEHDPETVLTRQIGRMRPRSQDGTRLTTPRTHPNNERTTYKMSWEDRRLLWAVREPFKSQRTQTSLTAGLIDQGCELVVQSLMPEGGIIFSDGIDSDYLPFNSGTTATICTSKQSARLVVLE